MIELSPFQLLASVATLVAVLLGGWLFALKWALGQFDKRLDVIVGEVKKVDERQNAQEKEHLRFVAYVTQHFVSREDWVRFSTAITSKIDSVAEALTDLRSAFNHDTHARSKAHGNDHGSDQRKAG